MKSNVVPSSPPRLAVFRALCHLSPEGYAPLARMILSTFRAEQACALMDQRRRARREATRRHVQNIGKPVITIDVDPDRPGA